MASRPCRARRTRRAALRSPPRSCADAPRRRRPAPSSLPPLISAGPCRRFHFRGTSPHTGRGQGFAANPQHPSSHPICLGTMIVQTKTGCPAYRARMTASVKQRREVGSKGRLGWEALRLATFRDRLDFARQQSDVLPRRLGCSFRAAASMNPAAGAGLRQ